MQDIEYLKYCYIGTHILCCLLDPKSFDDLFKYSLKIQVC